MYFYHVGSAQNEPQRHMFQPGRIVNHQTACRVRDDKMEDVRTEERVRNPAITTSSFLILPVNILPGHDRMICGEKVQIAIVQADSAVFRNHGIIEVFLVGFNRNDFHNRFFLGKYRAKD